MLISFALLLDFNRAMLFCLISFCARRFRWTSSLLKLLKAQVNRIKFQSLSSDFCLHSHYILCKLFCMAASYAKWKLLNYVLSVNDISNDLAQISRDSFDYIKFTAIYFSFSTEIYYHTSRFLFLTRMEKILQTKMHPFKTAVQALRFKYLLSKKLWRIMYDC